METFSKDSSRLIESPSLAVADSRSTGKVAMKLATEPGVLGSVSEESDTE